MLLTRSMQYAVICTVITKAAVLKHFGSRQAVAEFFGVHLSAVDQWKTYIPRSRAIELSHKIPDVFQADTSILWRKKKKHRPSVAA